LRALRLTVKKQRFEVEELLVQEICTLWKICHPEVKP
jgi:hypothetical protein